VPVHIRVHPVTFILRRFVREIIERLGPEMMLALFAYFAEVVNRCALVIYAFEFGQAARLFGR
jgi:hypothetical protein